MRNGKAIATGLAFMAFLGMACNDFTRNGIHPEISNADIKKGKLLAAQYCQSCHLLPDPAQLNMKSWADGVLPNMGPRLGIFSDQFQMYPNARNDQSLDKNYYPSKPMLTIEEWRQIEAYYICTSPDTLPSQSRSAPIKQQLPFFKTVQPDMLYPQPTTCYIKIDTLGGRSIMLSDVMHKDIVRLNSLFSITDSVNRTGPVVDMDFRKQEIVACDMEIVNPNNGKLGKAERIFIEADGKMKKDSASLFRNLARPVQITSADLNADGRIDYLICEFGNLTGALSWMENVGNNTYAYHVISPFPGAIKAYIKDENNDGLPDLWVLFAQGDEHISLFMNEGKGHFTENKLLRFPPSYGSSYFEQADFNHDGFIDILYTCGDNADYSYVLKPYHGIYIFLNDGKNSFKQQYFFPMNGCFKAMARDFDRDGDLDIAAISFFADYVSQPEEGFVYLENKGNNEFLPYTTPEAKKGRWLTMDAGDLDGDGKTDIILGNFSIAPSFIRSSFDWTQGPPFLFLKNVGQ